MVLASPVHELMVVALRQAVTEQNNNRVQSEQKRRPSKHRIFVSASSRFKTEV